MGSRIAAHVTNVGLPVVLLDIVPPGIDANAPNQERNVTVVSVLPGSAAEKAGLQPGDRITHLDGHWIAPIHLSFRELSSLEDDLGPQDGRPLDVGRILDTGAR